VVQLKPIAGPAFLYLLAAALQLSGIQSPAAAISLAALATVWLVYGHADDAAILRLRKAFPVSSFLVAVTLGATGGGLLGAGWWYWAGRQSPLPSQTDDPVLSRVRTLTPALQSLAGKGDKIEYDMRGANPRTAAELKPFATRIEDWRTEVSHFLAREVPGSGADTKFLMFTPTPGSAVMYEYARLNAMRANLVSILDSLEAYVRRSGLPADKQRSAIKELVMLREEGVTDLQNRDLRHDGQYAQFTYDFKQWELRVEDALTRARAPEGDISWFRVLGTFTPKGLPGINPLHARGRNMIAEKIDRLTDIISRLPRAL